MARNSAIEWTEHTWNPVTGCTKISEGCKHCYAEAMTRRFWRQWGCEPPPEHFKVKLHPERLLEPLHWRKPSRIFVCSMSDLFHAKVPSDFIDQVWAVMGACPQHTFQVLTKRPNQMLGYINGQSSGRLVDAIFRLRDLGANPKQLATFHDAAWPLPNLWLGVTAENQARFDERWEYLRQTPAAVYFISNEPGLGPLILPADFLARGKRAQVIVGGETGPGARPMHPAWVRSLRDQCQAAGVPFFFKGWGDWAPEYPQGINLTNVEERFIDGQHYWRVGKKRAGCLLDGVEYHEYPGAHDA